MHKPHLESDWESVSCCIKALDVKKLLEEARLSFFGFNGSKDLLIKNKFSSLEEPMQFWFN